MHTMQIRQRQQDDRQRTPTVIARVGSLMSSSLERGSKRSIRRKVVYCAIGAVCALPTYLTLGAPTANAYKTINEHCILRVEQPNPFGDGVFEYGGAVDCTGYGAVWSSLEVCAEVQNTETGKWYTINGTCLVDSKPVFTSYNPITELHDGVCGVNYRTWDFGAVWHGTEASGPTSEWGDKEYTSSVVNNAC